MASWIPAWVPYFGTPPPVKPMKPTDAMHHQVLRLRFSQFLDHTDPPKSFRAAEVAQSLSHKELKGLGYEDWKELLPAVVELAFEMRAFGYCEIIKGGNVLGEDVAAYEIEGSVRIRRNDGDGKIKVQDGYKQAFGN